MPITAVGITALSRVISRTPDAFASFPAAKLGTLLGLCNSISTPNQRSNVKNALCELNVAYADTTVPAEPPLRYGREKCYHNIYN